MAKTMYEALKKSKTGDFYRFSDGRLVQLLKIITGLEQESPPEVLLCWYTPKGERLHEQRVYLAEYPYIKASTFKRVSDRENKMLK